MHWHQQREWNADETHGPSMAKAFAVLLLIGAVGAAIFAIVT